MSLPLKARLVLRDLWSGRSSPVQRSLTSLSHVLGRDVACDPLWPQLLTNLDAVYSDESDFITAVAAVVQGWCGVVEEMLRRTERGRKALGGHPENDRDDSDDDEADRTGENGEEVDAEEMVRRKEMRKEWEGNLIRRLKEAGAFALNLYLEVDRVKAPSTSWDSSRGGFVIIMPSTSSSFHHAPNFISLFKCQIVAAFESQPSPRTSIRASSTSRGGSISNSISTNSTNNSHSNSHTHNNRNAHDNHASDTTNFNHRNSSVSLASPVSIASSTIAARRIAFHSTNSHANSHANTNNTTQDNKSNPAISPGSVSGPSPTISPGSTSNSGNGGGVSGSHITSPGHHYASSTISARQHQQQRPPHLPHSSHYQQQHQQPQHQHQHQHQEQHQQQQHQHQHQHQHQADTLPTHNIDLDFNSDLLPRPEDLLSQPPYHMFIHARSHSIDIQCSHSSSLELLASYLRKWCRINHHRSDSLPLVTVKLHQSPFGFSPIHDTLVLVLENRHVGSPNLSPAIILGLVESVLGYKPVHADASSWQYRRDSLLPHG